jgi:membrane-bound ClpP family serine protease
MPIRTKKKMDKQVKKDIQSASLEASSVPTFDNTSIGSLLSRLPSVKKKKEVAVLKSFEKSFNVKKRKTLGKQSKRTNTGLMDTESPPHHVHTEGERWRKVTNKQVKANNKIFNKASLKKK